MHLVHLILLVAFLSTPLLAENPPPASIRERLAMRTFPSVFQAWTDAAPTAGSDRETMMARHDFVFQDLGGFGLKWDGDNEGLSTTFTPDSLARSREKVARLRAKNPALILLAEIRYTDGPPRFLPEGHAWWKRDAEGHFVKGWEEGGYLEFDIASSDFQTQVAKRCLAVVASGCFDGVMLDSWRDDDDDRLALLRHVRESIGPDALVILNGNDRRLERAAAYANGIFMECWRTKVPLDWDRLATTLRWSEQHMREPRVNCLETWYRESRADLPLMRATTTIALTQSDGFCLFSDPNPLPTPDHAHDWYPFWDKSLGRARGPGSIRPDGSWVREFDGGTALYNPPDHLPAEITFARPHHSRATGKTARDFAVPALDGDIFTPAE